MVSPSPERPVPKPVLYTAPDWVQDCGVDEWLNQSGYATTNAQTDRPINQPGTSSLDDPDMNIGIDEEQNNKRTTVETRNGLK